MQRQKSWPAFVAIRGILFGMGFFPPLLRYQGALHPRKFSAVVRRCMTLHGQSVYKERAMLINAQQSLNSTQSLGTSTSQGSNSPLGGSVDARAFMLELQNQLTALASSIEVPSQAASSTNTASALANFQATVNLFASTYATLPSGSALDQGTAPTLAVGRSTLQQDFNTYFDSTSPNQVIQAGGGTVTRNSDGSATWSGDGRTYTYSRDTPLEAVASNTGLGAEWASTYGVDLQASSTSTTAIKAPFGTFNEFRTWEAGLGSNFAADYEPPDYVHMMGLSLGGGGDEAFKRFVFLKNNPKYAVDFEKIHDGKSSQFPSNGSTLIKSDLAEMPTETAAFYRNNPDQLRMAEGFNMDPVLYKMNMDGTLAVPLGKNASEWMMQNKWTAAGIVPNDNRLSYTQAPYRGLDGTGSDNYRMAQYNTASGGILDFDGKTYNPVTGEVMA